MKFYPSTIQPDLINIKNHFISEQIVLAEDEITKSSDLLNKISGHLKTGYIKSFYLLLKVTKNHAVT